MLRKSILFVDDEKLILDSFSRDLTCANPHFAVSQASSGEEAVAKIQDGQWDMVITDLHMPGIDGFQVLDSAKKKNPLTMVIILTGFADMDAAINALRLGADDFLQKPCDNDELLYRMANCFVKQDLQKKVAIYENILPVCSYCNKIRNDQQQERGQGTWFHLEDYFQQVQGVLVSHGICPDCLANQINSAFSGSVRVERLVP